MEAIQKSVALVNSKSVTSLHIQRISDFSQAMTQSTMPRSMAGDSFTDASE